LSESSSPTRDGRDKVKRNVVEITEVPAGLPGRPSKALTAQQADDVITKTASDRMHPYIVVSLLTGARTEELRALRWEHVHLEGRSDVTPPVPPFVEVCGARCARAATQRP
jgi:integrase